MVVLTVHAAACALALVYLPRGFPPSDIHSWSNTWLPAAAGVVIASALVRFVFFQSSGLFVSLVTAAIAGGWLAAVATSSVLFPTSFDVERAIGPGAIAIAIATLAWATKLRTAPSLAVAVIGAAFGVVEVLAQRAPLPSTRPAGGAVAEVKGEPTKDDAATGQVSFPCGKEHVRVRPLLTFESRLPDATWTVLAPPDAFGPRRKFEAFLKEKNGFRAFYTDDGTTSLVATKDAKGLEIEAVSKLPRAVYSHLNAFTTIYVPFETSLSFSATASDKLVIEPADFPGGGPLSFAYLGPDMAFHVVRASDAEKGPFTELAKGRLGRDEPLAIEIPSQGREHRDVQAHVQGLDVPGQHRAFPLGRLRGAAELDPAPVAREGSADRADARRDRSRPRMAVGRSCRGHVPEPDPRRHGDDGARPHQAGRALTAPECEQRRTQRASPPVNLRS